MELFDKIKKIVPGVTISTDIIVGFPGEDINLFHLCTSENSADSVFGEYL